METFVVLQPCLNHKAGDEVQYNPGDVEHFVSTGKLQKKSAKDMAEADKNLGSVSDKIAENVFAKVVSKLSKLETTGSGLTIPTDFASHAEAKENQSFADWLWCAAGSVQTKEIGKRQFCDDRIRNKYHTKSAEGFDQRYNEAISKGAGGYGHTTSADGRQVVEKASVQQESIGAIGGFTVPIQYSTELFQLATPMSLFLGRCKRYTMTGKQLLVPAIDYSLGGSGASPYLGGMSAAWVAENVGFTQESAKVRQIEFNANMLAGYTQSSRTLLADSSIALGQALTGLMAQAIAFNCDYTFFKGTGNAQPKGMTVSSACKTFTRGTWATAGLLLADLALADSYLIPELEGEAIWVVPPSFKSKLYTLNDASSRVVFLPNFPNATQGPAGIRPKMAVFGKDLFWSQLPTSSGTAGDVNLLIPSLYGIALRDEIEIGVSEHYAWTTNLLTWRFMFRGDGQSLLNTYLTLQNGDIVAPFVSIV